MIFVINEKLSKQNKYINICVDFTMYEVSLKIFY